MIKKRYYFLLMILIITVAFAGLAIAELTGDQIMAKVDELMNSTSGKYLADIIIVRPGKDDRISRVQVHIKGIDKVLVRYLEPIQEKGQGYLRLGDNSWLYLPNANKSIRVSGRQSLQGSDLSNDDILKVKITEEYSAKLLGSETVDGEDNYLLELCAKSPKAAYGKLKYWVRQSDFIPTRTEYYAISGKLIKTATYSQIKEIGGKVRPIRMEIVSELRKGYRTVFLILEADYTAENPDSIFTKLNLEKGK